MGPYLVYFIIGGTVVSAVAYIGKNGDGMAAGFVAGLPILFVINLFLLYQHGGMSAGLSFTRGALVYAPFFTIFVLLTLILLPRVGMPWAVLGGISMYSVPAIVRPYVAWRNRARTSTRAWATMQPVFPETSMTVVRQVNEDAEDHCS